MFMVIKIDYSGKDKNITFTVRQSGGRFIGQRIQAYRSADTGLPVNGGRFIRSRNHTRPQSNERTGFNLKKVLFEVAGHLTQDIMVRGGRTINAKKCSKRRPDH